MKKLPRSFYAAKTLSVARALLGKHLVHVHEDIDKCHNGHDLLSDSLYLQDVSDAKPKIISRPRIGVDYAGEWAKKELRFYIDGNPYVSKP